MSNQGDKSGSTIMSIENLGRHEEEENILELRKGLKEDRIKKKEIKDQKNKLV